MAHQQRQGTGEGAPLADVVPLPVGLGYVPAATPGAPTVGQPPTPAPPVDEGSLVDEVDRAEEHARVLTGRVLPVVPAAATPVLRALRPDRLAWAIVRHEIYYGTLGTARGLWALWTWATARELDAHLATQPRLVLDARQRRQRIAWAGLGATTAAGAVVWWAVGPVAIVAALLAVLAVAGGVERAVRHHQQRPHPEDQPLPVEVDRAEEPALPRLLGTSPTESRIIARLDRWADLAAGRGLDGLSLVDLRASESGLVATLGLSGRWTAARVAAPDTVGRIRAALSVPSSVRLDVAHGAVGDEVELRIRTRERRTDALWTPDRAGTIGLDTDTGQAVPIPPGRLLVAGTSGAGKSVALRVLMASALLAEEPTAVVYLDGKGEESSLWHNVRVAVEPDEIDAAITEVTEEAGERRDLMRANRVATWTPSPERPRLVVVVDEGAEIIAMDSRRLALVDRLCSLARVGRSRRIDVVWCTQKPTIGDGIPRQVNGVMDTRLVLRTAGVTETRQVLGPDWRAHELTGAGLAYLSGTGRGPDQAPIQVWDLSADETVTALPARTPWQHGAPAEEAQGADAEEQERALTVLTEMARAQLVSDLVTTATVRELLPDMTDVQRANYLTGLGCERGRTRGARGWRIDSVQAALQRLRDRR